MTADIVNLRQRRKAKQRADKDQQAAENRAKFGRTKHERAKEAAQVDLATRRLDGHRTDPARSSGDDN